MKCLRRIRLGCAVLAAVLIATACQREAGKQSEAVNEQSSPPDSNTLSTAPNTGERRIHEIRSAGEAIYAAAKEGQWTTAQKKLQALREAERDLDVSDVKSQLEQASASLSKSIEARDVLTTMRESNKVTLLAAQLDATYHPRTQDNTERLSYYGRELEIASQSQDMGKIQSILQGLRETWNEVKPVLETHAGQAEADKFDDILSRLDAAKTPGEVGQLAQAELAEASRIKAVIEEHSL